MCGIVGSITPHKVLSAERKRLALSFLAHRGPDGQGEFQDIPSGVWLGHTRLSIIDLSSAGNQPMTFSEESLTLTFNGEIYNYQALRKELQLLGRTFLTNSDTEVLLQAWAEWGKKCLQRINGMFAFGLYDASTGFLYLARDRAGEKPLYFSQQGKDFFFASEIPALNALTDHPLEWDEQGIQAYLGQGYISGKNTCWKSIQKLKPGQLLTYNPTLQFLEIESHWEPTRSTSIDREIDPVEKLDELLSEVVNSQLMADVPVGLMLSGGLDSSLLASYLAETNPKLKAFTVVFPGFEKLNESSFSKEISTYFGLEHQEIICDRVGISDWLQMVQRLESPVSDPAFYPTYLMSKAIRTKCKVALGGDGADEVFGGYERYSNLLQLKKKADSIPLFLRKSLGKVVENILPIGAKGRHSLMELGQDMSLSPPEVPSLFLESELKELLKPDYSRWIQENKKEFEYSKDSTWTDRLLEIDFKTYLPDNILTKVDRASMLAGLEVRAPFLDRRVLDFAHGLPSNWKVTERERKVILKKLAEKRLPRNWNTERKQGFVPPLEHWLQEKEWKELIQTYLLDQTSFFNPKFIRSLLQGQEKGRFNKRRIYALLVISIHSRSNQR